MTHQLPLDEKDDIESQFRAEFDDVRTIEIPGWLADDKRFLVPDADNEYVVGVQAETDDALGIVFWMNASESRGNRPSFEDGYFSAAEYESDNVQWLPKSQIEVV